MIGQTLGSYRIEGQIGAGGMGVVYNAIHPLIGRKAAIKMLLPELSSNAEVVDRFFNEARAVTMINHPGLVNVFDFGYAPNGSAYIVMEFLEGESLASRIRRDGRLPATFVVATARQIAQGLHAAHARQIVHRDLKPDNLFLSPDPAVPGGLRAKILDFGIAKLAGDSTVSHKTRTGSVMGTPTYMSPEQCRGAGTVDARADVYALGCILFEMLCGRPPFVGEGIGEILGKHMYEEPPPPRSLEPSIPPALEAVLMRALAKKPEARQQSMEQLSIELDLAVPYADGHNTGGGFGTTHSRAATAQPVPMTTLGGSASQIASVSSYGPPPRRSGKLIAAGAGAVLVAGIAIFFAVRPGPTDPAEGAASAPGAGATAAAAPAAEPPAANTPVANAPAANTPVANAPAAAASPPAAAAAIDAGPVVTAAPAAAAPAAVAIDAGPQRVTLHIDTTPPAAEVFRARDGARVGKTPFEEQLAPATGKAIYIVKLAGYEDQRVELDASTDSRRAVPLRKIAKRTTGRRTTGRTTGGREALDPFGK